MIHPVDYDDRQHRGYRAGRSMPVESQAVWSKAFARRAPEHRPLTALDLGSGTGRMTPLLAETFGGPTYGVEPSARMREQAEAASHSAKVRYLAGQAEAIPLQDGVCDLVVMFLSLHHVRDRAVAAGEIRRVLAPGGRVLIRSQLADRLHPVEWHAYFDGAREIELRMFPTSQEVIAMFGLVGLDLLAIDVVRERYADSLVENAGRLKTRSISTFEHMDEATIQAGFARLDEAVARDPGGPIYGDGDVMTFGSGR